MASFYDEIKLQKGHYGAKTPHITQFSSSPGHVLARKCIETRQDSTIYLETSFRVHVQHLDRCGGRVPALSATGWCRTTVPSTDGTSFPYGRAPHEPEVYCSTDKWLTCRRITMQSFTLIGALGGAAEAIYERKNTPALNTILLTSRRDGAE